MALYGPDVEEDLDELEWPLADYSCSAPFCGEPMPYAEDLYMITMFSAGMVDNGIQYLPVPADDGDYLYEPCYFCSDCWQHVIEEVKERTKDVPPVADDQSSIACSICESGIRLGELFGVAFFGQLQVSDRCPDAVPTPAFRSMDTQPSIICISCMNVMEKDVSELWGDRITQYDECEAGTSMRCWRHGCPADGTCDHIHSMETG